MSQFLSFLGSETGRMILSLLLVAVVVAILVILCRSIFGAIMTMMESKKEDKNAIKDMDLESVEEDDKGRVLRELVAADGIDPFSAEKYHFCVDFCGTDELHRMYVFGFCCSHS